MKKIVKIIILFIVTLSIGGAEIYLLMQQEQKRQESMIGEIYDTIDFNFNMTKIAAQTGDSEMFSKNINEAKNKIREIEKLFLVKSDDEDYVRKINEHLEFLENKKDFLGEVGKLKSNILEIEKSLKDSYGEENKIQKETFGNIAEEIGKIKINAEEYQFEKIKQVAIRTNEMLDKVAARTNELAKCVGVCYKNAITKINEELISDVKDFNAMVSELNLNIENEFNFEATEKIKEERPRSL